LGKWAASYIMHESILSTLTLISCQTRILQGGSDIRRGGTALSNRIVVAGGGGGAGGNRVINLGRGTGGGGGGGKHVTLNTCTT
jgi:hypothetical protein